MKKYSQITFTQKIKPSEISERAIEVSVVLEQGFLVLGLETGSDKLRVGFQNFDDMTTFLNKVKDFVSEARSEQYDA